MPTNKKQLTQFQTRDISAENYRNLVEESIVGVFQTHVNGDVIFMNRSFRTMFDIPDDTDFKSLNAISIYKKPEQREHVISELKSKNNIRNYEIEVAPNNKQCSHVSLSAMLQGEIIHGTIIDISEKKRAEEALIKNNETLSRINMEKDRFFSIIAHDLRSPFNSFLGLTEVLADQLDQLTLNELQKLTSSLRKSARNVNRLLENLLQWSRVEQGLISFNPNYVNMLEMAQKFGESCIITAQIKAINLSMNIPPDLMLYVDEDMFHTIMRNLVNNAIKFTPPGGNVKVSAEKIDGKDVCISVSDNGIGMNQAIQKNLFSISAQCKRNGTNGEPSSGLGLILCKAFIEKHKGKIWVESKENEGSTFYVAFTSPSIKQQ